MLLLDVTVRRDEARRAEIDRLLKLHPELIWQERRTYYLHRYKARKYPERYMTSIADGMDRRNHQCTKAEKHKQGHVCPFRCWHPSCWLYCT